MASQDVDPAHYIEHMELLFASHAGLTKVVKSQDDTQHEVLEHIIHAIEELNTKMGNNNVKVTNMEMRQRKLCGLKNASTRAMHSYARADSCSLPAKALKSLIEDHKVGLDPLVRPNLPQEG